MQHEHRKKMFFGRKWWKFKLDEATKKKTRQSFSQFENHFSIKQIVNRRVQHELYSFSFSTIEMEIFSERTRIFSFFFENDRQNNDFFPESSIFDDQGSIFLFRDENFDSTMKRSII